MSFAGTEEYYMHTLLSEAIAQGQQAAGGNGEFSRAAQVGTLEGCLNRIQAELRRGVPFEDIRIGGMS